MHERGAIVTIDGPSGAGKSTISRMVAARLGYTYLDTGAMYRAVGLATVRGGIDLDDTEALGAMLDGLALELLADNGDTRVLLGGEDVSAAIRTAEMGMVASRVSAHPLVRQKLTGLQRQIGHHGGIVAEGRDMGTVVFPEAEHKFYLDASPEERARRRRLQLREQGQEVDFDTILAQIVKRDRDDSGRALAPLKPAPDAVIIDTSVLPIEAVVTEMLAHIESGERSQQEVAMAGESRRLKRHHLVFYLEVFDDNRDEQLGRLVDITTGGIKLVSKEPIPIGQEFRLRMVLPEGYFEDQVLRFEAQSLWSNNDVNPDFFDTGFKVAGLDSRAVEIVGELIESLGFND